jgi:hypothetical protein
MRNDVVMIFTDGEEAGLLGASSFVAEHPLADRGGVVLNWEATGNAGVGVVWNLVGNAELIKELAVSAPYPVGDSALAALYRAGMQNSDFTVFRDAGGLVVDRFDESHPHQANLLYAMDADTRTAMWASQNRTRDPWTARYVPISNGEAEPPHPLPYRVTPGWTGTADVVPMDPPRIDVLAPEARVTAPR